MPIMHRLQPKIHQHYPNRLYPSFAPNPLCTGPQFSVCTCKSTSPRRRPRSPAAAALALSYGFATILPVEMNLSPATSVVHVATTASQSRRASRLPILVASGADVPITISAQQRDLFREPFVNTKRPLVTYHVGRDAEREMLWRMCVAIACGAIIGMERRAASASAGVRTLSLVSLGAAVFTLTALLSVNGNSSRMGAAVSTGIGFLGAGAIHHDSTQRHLVTAASVWIAAALGVAAASGLKFLALIAALITVWIMRWGVLSRYLRLVWRRKLPTFIAQLKVHLKSLRRSQEMP